MLLCQLLLINADNLCQGGDDGDVIMNNSDYFRSVLNEFYKADGQKPIEIEEFSDPSMFITKFHEAGFFDHFGKQMVKYIGDEDLDQAALVGLILAAKTGDLELMRYSLAELYGGQINSESLNGILALLTRDTRAELEISRMAKALGINGELMLRVLRLSTCSLNGPNPHDSVMNLTRGHVSAKVQIFAEIISIIKGDVQDMVNISAELGMNSNHLMIVLAMAKGRLDLLGKQYHTLSQLLQIQNLDSLQIITEFACGNFEKL